MGKAKYRRAVARYELGKDEAALQDVDAVLKELPDPSSNKEAVALKDQIKARLEKAAKPSEPPAGFKRMQIVEEDESDDEPASSRPASPPSVAKTVTPAKASEPPAGFKRMQIVEEDESDDEPGPSKPASPPSAKAEPASPTNEPYPDIKVE